MRSKGWKEGQFHLNGNQGLGGRPLEGLVVCQGGSVLRDADESVYGACFVSVIANSKIRISRIEDQFPELPIATNLQISADRIVSCAGNILHRMADSDPEYIASSEDEDGHYLSGRKSSGRHSRAKSSSRRDPKQNADGAYVWEGEFQRSWDLVQEDEEGSLTGVVAGIVQSGKRRR